MISEEPMVIADAATQEDDQNGLVLAILPSSPFAAAADMPDDTDVDASQFKFGFLSIQHRSSTTVSHAERASYKCSP